MGKIYFRVIMSVALPVLCCGAAHAQDGKVAGRLSGSFETNTIWYVPDMAATPPDRFGSNSYMKLDYSLDKLAVGVQYELYAPVLQGFSPELDGGKLTNKFASWTDGGFAVVAGDFYEQFGNGLALRSYEDRALGFNNSIEGVRAGYGNDIFSARALWGRPRLYMDYADTWVRGADLSVSLSSLLGISGYRIALEGSYLNRFDEQREDPVYGVSPDMNVWSGRVAFDSDWGLSFQAEYVGKGDDPYLVAGKYEPKRGNAQLAELGYSAGGLGVLVTGRRLDHMMIGIETGETSPSNVLNYLPSLTRQYTYSLATLDPYSTEAEGEQGVQADLFYKIRKGTLLGGRYGTKLHANGSILYPLERKGRRMSPYYSDFSFDVERQWVRKFKTTLMYAVQTFSPDHAATATTWVHNVFVADMLYKFTSRNSLRLELQYLYSAEDDGDWWAAGAEFNMAPRWSFFVNDMYNQGRERVHYYSGGLSYSRSRTRAAISYGRNRAGYVCSGGVCRYMPAYTGANIAITTSF